MSARKPCKVRESPVARPARHTARAARRAISGLAVKLLVEQPLRGLPEGFLRAEPRRSVPTLSPCFEHFVHLFEPLDAAPVAFALNRTSAGAATHHSSPLPKGDPHAVLGAPQRVWQQVTHGSALDVLPNFALRGAKGRR